MRIDVAERLFLLVFFMIAGLLVTTHCSVVYAATTDEVVSLVRYDSVSLQEVETLLDNRYHFDIAAFSPGKYLDILVNSNERKYLEKMGYEGSVLIKDVADYFEKKINYDGFMGNYRTYDEMVEYLQDIRDSYPDIARLYDIGDTWEKVNMGEDTHDIWALKLSDNPDFEDPEEAGVLYIGAYHAREIITPEVVMYLIDYFTSGYGDDPEVTSIIDNTELWFIPIMNVDGHITVEKGNIMWRKTRNHNDSPFELFWGVDPNRNHSYKWGYNNSGSSPFKFMDDYRGTGPASEPENQAIERFARMVDLTFSMSYHSYSELLLFPYSYKDLNTPDHDFYCAFSAEATKYNGYTWGNPGMGAIYNCNGELDDFMYGDRNGKKKVLSFTSEVGTTFWPDDSKIEELCQENFYPAYMMAYLANNPYEIFPYKVEAWTETPVVAPGDNLDFHYRYSNLSDETVSMQIWSIVWQDDELVVDRAMPPQEVTILPGEYFEGSMSHHVPENAPEGLYTYEARLGTYPENLRGNDKFCFTIER